MSDLKSYVIRVVRGVESRTSGTDEDRGALTCADGVNVVPRGAVTFGPSYLTVWGKTALGTDIATALAGATPSKVHLVLVTRGSTTFVVAWEITAARPQGLFQVSGVGDPSFASTGSVVITATATSVYRDKANSLTWYGSWMADELWLGNGTDANLVWAAGASALALLGPSGTPDAMDTSQVVFPPCKSWSMDPNGRRYGAGNVTNPLRIWRTALPNITYPKPQGLKALAYAYKDIQPTTPGATSITALGFVGESLVVHFNIGSPLILTITDSEGGWAFDQRPMDAAASAINPNCVRDTKIAPFYLGGDLEVYAPKQRQSYNKSAWRDDDIKTNRSGGDWNVAMTKPISGSDYFVVYDDKGGRFWLWGMMSAGSRQGVYCYDEFSFAITGPWRYPDFLSICQCNDGNLNSCLVCGITRDGVWLYADLYAVGSIAPPSYGTALAAAYLPLVSAPTSDPGIPYVGIDAVTGAAIQVLNSQTLYLADPWSAWSASGSVVPTVYFKNARLAIIELVETDLENPDANKEISALRLMWERNPYAYVTVMCEVNGYRFGAYRGSFYPYQNWICGLRGLGPTVRIRLLVVSFNDQNCCLNSLTIDWLPSVDN